MTYIKLLPKPLKLTLAFSLALVNFTTCSTRIQAQPTKPVVSTVRLVPPPPPPPLADRGAPFGRQRGGASRGQCPNVGKPLTALVPATKAMTAEESVWGLTDAEYPTFWFYVPYSLTPKLPVEFVLQDDDGNYVYKGSLTASQKQAGIVKLRLPSTAGPLEVGKMYKWYFLVDCDPDAPPLVEGWVERRAMNPTLMSQLKNATPRQRVTLYAANGFWHDALTTLAELRSANPGDTTLSRDWVSLLHSVGLDAIAPEPIIECCTLEK